MTHTSAFGSYSGCRQYIEDIDRARAALENAPRITKLPPFSDHAMFIEAMTDRVKDALAELPQGELLFTAHSIPLAMADSSPYVAQLKAACARVAANVGREKWELVYQSRSGPPGQPWLEPGVLIPFRYGDYTAMKRRYWPDDYRRDASGFAIEQTVYVETEWDPTDSCGEMDFIAGVRHASRYPSVAVGQVRFEEPASAATLAKACDL